MICSLASYLCVGQLMPSLLSVNSKKNVEAKIKNSCLVFVDHEKAFDRMTHRVL